MADSKLLCLPPWDHPEERSNERPLSYQSCTVRIGVLPALGMTSWLAAWTNIQKLAIFQCFCLAAGLGRFGCHALGTVNRCEHRLRVWITGILFGSLLQGGQSVVKLVALEVNHP